MTEGKTSKVVNKKIKVPDGIKRVTTFSQHIEGYVTKINNVGGSIKKITLEGKISEVEILELNDFGIISAKLNDDTGSVVIMMCEKGNLSFRKLVEKVHEGQEYRIFGNISKDLIVLVKNIEIL